MDAISAARGQIAIENSDDPAAAFLEAVANLSRAHVREAYGQAVMDGTSGPDFYEQLNVITTSQIEAMRETLAPLETCVEIRAFADRAEAAIVDAAEQEVREIALRAQWGSA